MATEVIYHDGLNAFPHPWHAMHVGLPACRRLSRPSPKDLPRLSNPARRNDPGSTLAGHFAMPNDRASTRNTRVRTSNRDRDSRVDRQPRPRLSLLHSMARSRNKVRTPDSQHNNQCIQMRRSGPKEEEPAESIVSISFLFHSCLLLRDQKSSFSHNTIRFRQNFTRLHLARPQFAEGF
jgi:hypothetical protein